MYYLIFLFFLCTYTSIFSMEKEEKEICWDTPKSIELLLQAEKSYRIDPSLIPFAQDKIKQGNALLHKIATNPAFTNVPCHYWHMQRKEYSADLFLKEQANYIQDIIAICWGLFNKAAEKDQFFTGGTIVVIDQSNHDYSYGLFNFLFNYACFVNPNIKIGKNPSHIISNNPFAYSRLSTHFPEIHASKNFLGQYGIDIRFGKSGLAPLLPSNKQHILFGKLEYANLPLTFIKFETYGLGIEKKEMFKHVQKAFQKSSKDIRQTHSKASSRREDVPNDVKKKWHELLAMLPAQEKIIIKHHLKNNFKYIRTYYREAQRLMAQHQLYSSKAQELVTFLENHFDYLELRRGNEVIIDLRDFILK